MSFKITGIVVEKESGKGLSDLVVKAYDKDLLYDDLLGSTETDQNGRFQITYEEKDYKELFDSKPDIYFEIKNKKAEKIYSSEEKIRFGAYTEEDFKVEIPRSFLPTINNDIDDNEINANYTSFNLRHLMVVFNLTVKKGKIEEIFNAFQEVAKANPKAVVLLPNLMLNALITKCLYLGACTGKTATATVTMTNGIVMSITRTVNFNYSYTGGPTCTVKVESVRVVVGSMQMKVNKISDGNAFFSGEIPTAAGQLTVNTSATISATFKASAGCCDTCNLPTPTVSISVTIK